MKEQNRCPLCDHGDFVTVHRFELIDEFREPESVLHKTNDYHRNYVLFEHLLKRSVDRLDVVFFLCRNCGLIFFSPRPDEHDLTVKYRLVTDQCDTLRREQKHRLVDQRKKRATHIRSLLRRFWRTHTRAALDIGGADGHCLSGLLDEFECGLLDYETRDLWPGVKKLGNNLGDLPPNRKFDVIMTLHTLEHIPDVGQFIETITRHLSEDAVLYIEVPFGCSQEIYRTKNLITHINFFSEGSLGYLLEQKGLTVEFMASRPVLSSKRYLPVIQAIARKSDHAQGERQFMKSAFEITRKQMKQTHKASTTLANIGLVLSNPIKYAAAFKNNYLRKIT